MEGKITKGKIIVDGVLIDTEKTEIASACILEVEVGTNGYQGGDTGHGGRTFFRLENLACTDMLCEVEYDGQRNAKEIKIGFGGDCELECFIEALRFAWDRLMLKINY